MKLCSSCGVAPRYTPKCALCRECRKEVRHRRLLARVPDADDLLAISRYATPTEAAVLDLLVDGSTISDAATALGIKISQALKRVTKAKNRAARQGVSPSQGLTEAVPDGYYVKGVSSYYKVDPDTGEKQLTHQWVKTRNDESENMQRMIDAIGVLAEPYQGLGGRSDPPAMGPPDYKEIMSAMPWGDPHLGMHAWASEVGENFDLDIAFNNMLAASRHLIEISPPSKVFLIVNVGDFFHSDNRKGVTERGGNALDTDSRYPKVLDAGIELERQVIHMALKRHATVKVINSLGNHDWHSSIMLSKVMAAYFGKDKRVEIDTSPAAYHWHRHGKCLIGVTHGVGMTPQKLHGIMSVDRAEDWGDTIHRHWYTGHVHHDRAWEHYGVTGESFRTLAGRDEYHHSQGYRSGRDMKCDVWHTEHGLINRSIVGINRLIGGDCGG